MAVFAWKEDYKSMKLRMDKYKGNESNAWALIYDQCSPELKNKLEGTEGYDGAKSTNNVAKLLTMIRGYCCQFDLLSNEYMVIVAAVKNLFYFFQKAEQSNEDYHKDFMAMLEVIEEYGGAGSMTHFPNMLKREIEADGTDNVKVAEVKVAEVEVAEVELANVAVAVAAIFLFPNPSVKEDFIFCPTAAAAFTADRSCLSTSDENIPGLIARWTAWILSDSKSNPVIARGREEPKAEREEPEDNMAMAAGREEPEDNMVMAPEEDMVMAPEEEIVSPSMREQHSNKLRILITPGRQQ